MPSTKKKKKKNHSIRYDGRDNPKFQFSFNLNKNISKDDTFVHFEFKSKLLDRGWSGENVLVG